MIRWDSVIEWVNRVSKELNASSTTEDALEIELKIGIGGW